MSASTSHPTTTAPKCPFSGAAASSGRFGEPAPPSGVDEVMAEAESWWAQYRNERPAVDESRWASIKSSIEATGVWEMSSDELAWSARIAWRNNTRCIGRLFWRGLVVRDCRESERPEEVAADCFEHLRLAFNGGKIRPMVTLFSPQRPGRGGIEILNHQLARYAGYRRPDGQVVGEPESLDLTELAQSLGWEGKGTAFDLLPLLLKTADGEVHLFPMPDDCVHEVELAHPSLEWFQELGLRWYSVPAISNMRMQAGGLNFAAAPFSGWYMSTEIGSRNFGDQERYNMLPQIAERLGLDTSSPRSLWQERALLEVNVAVLHSFSEAGVTLTDHHTASDEFVRFVEKEREAGREVYANRDWIVPPMSPARCSTWDMEFLHEHRTPNFFL